MADTFDEEILSLEELDGVGGGNYVELGKDLKFFLALGMVEKKDVPDTVDVSNFYEVNRLVYNTWKKFNITMGGNEGLHNTYTLPKNAYGYANSRRSALRYAITESDRPDINIDHFI